MSIIDWPQTERPREKLLRQGAGMLSDAELLAIFLRTGMKGVSAVDLGRHLIRDFGSLTALLSAGEQAFVARPGLGRSKYAQLVAAQELMQRVLHEELQQVDALESSWKVREFLRLKIGAREIEIFMVIFLNVRNHVLSVHEISQGTLTETRVYPREIVRLALLNNASAVLVAHNHPAGSAEPSDADISLTGVLKKTLQMVDIKLLDHFVVTSHSAVSLAERGWL